MLNTLRRPKLERASDCTALFELSAKMDQFNEKLGHSLPFYNTANFSKMAGDATTKPPESLWRKLWRVSGLP
jgi:hypothetical protein